MRGDLCKEKTSAIVNPANEQLTNQGGLSEQIVRHGGKAIVDACRQYLENNARLETGTSFVSKAGNLPCQNVVHTVGPVYGAMSPDNARWKLRDTVMSCLKTADGHGIESLSMPWISSGIFSYPLKECVVETLDVILTTLPSLPNLKTVHILHIDFELLSSVVYPTAIQVLSSRGIPFAIASEASLLLVPDSNLLFLNQYLCEPFSLGPL